MVFIEIFRHQGRRNSLLHQYNPDRCLCQLLFDKNFHHIERYRNHLTSVLSAVLWWMTSAEIWLGCDNDMKTNTLKVGDKVKVIRLIVPAPEFDCLVGMTGTVEQVLTDYRTDEATGKPLPDVIEAVLVDFGFERAPDFFFVEELELIP